MAQASRQSIFTNRDLNKPITGSKSRTYTNADLDTEDDFQPDDNFNASADDDFQPDDVAAPQNTTTAVSENAPDTWNEGFLNSIISGDALNTSLQSAKGIAKGAILDLPGGIWNAAKTFGNAALASSGPIGEMITGKSPMDRFREVGEVIGSIPEGLRSVGELASQSGARPEEFGRMAGQVLGQPLVTGGLVKAAPSMVRGAGLPIEYAGKGIKNYGIGMPRILESRLQRGIERGIGSGIENVGQRMRQVGKPTPKPIQGEIVPDELGFTEGQVIPDNGPLELPPSRTSYYQGAADEPTIQPGNTRLYRGGHLTEHPNYPGESLNFTADVQHAREFAKIRNEPLSYIDIPNNELSMLRSKTLPQDADISVMPPSGQGFRNGPSVYQLTPEQAKRAQPVVHNTSITRNERANYDISPEAWQEKLAQQVLDEGAPEVQLSQTPFKATAPDNVPIAEPQVTPQAIQAMEQVRPTKPAVRLNPDGTYTRFDTGEIVDSTGKPMAAPPKTQALAKKYPGEMNIEDLRDHTGGVMPEIHPQDVSEFIRNVTGQDTRVFNKAGDVYTGAPRPKQTSISQATTGKTELVGKSDLKYGDTAELADAQGNIWWEDNLTDPIKIDQLNRKIAAREIDVVQKTGGLEDMNVTPTSLPAPTSKAREVTIKNAPPNQRAKVMRGQHDAVDIFFENPADRRIFGAGQNMFTSGKVTNPALIQTYQDVTGTIAKEYGLPIEKARELVTSYNRRLRELSKDMPKYGEDLNFKAPSFETFMDSALRGKQPTHPMNIRGEKGSVTIKSDPILKQLGSNKQTMPREQFDALYEAGWRFKPAGLYQSPGAPQAHPMWRVVQISPTDKRPFIFVPPKPKP